MELRGKDERVGIHRVRLQQQEEFMERVGP